MYVTQVSNLSTDCPHIEEWGLSLLSITESGEIKKPIGPNRSPPLIKKTSALLLDGQSSS